MSRRIIVFLAGVIFFSGFNFAYAGVVVNEIMYDLDGSDIDWVEIYNGDVADIDLTTLKLLISNSTSNHSIDKYSLSGVLHADDYGVIVPTSSISAFVSKWGSSLNLFTASFSLPNDTAKVEINNGDKNTPIDSVIYNSTQGASGDGKSLQLISGSFVAATPTPGVKNSSGTSTSSSESPSASGALVDNNSSNNSSASDINTKNKQTEIQKIKVELSVKTLGFVGLPILFEGRAFGYSGEELQYGKYFWNFGDGDSKSVNLSSGGKITHTYFYPGEYQVNLEYYTNFYGDTPDASNKIVLKIIPEEVIISAVGEENDFFVELSNNSNYDADISKWMLASGVKSFIFPKNTIITAKKKIIISPRVTGFSVLDKNTLKLFTPEGATAFDYFASTHPSSSVIENSVVKVSTQNKTQTSKTEEKNPENFSSLSLATSSVSENLYAKDEEANAINGASQNFNWPFFGFAGLVLLAGGTTYFLRQKKNPGKPGDDFKILE